MENEFVTTRRFNSTRLALQTFVIAMGVLATVAVFALVLGALFAVGEWAFGEYAPALPAAVAFSAFAYLYFKHSKPGFSSEASRAS